MEWTRSPLMRALALAASVGLVVVYWDERGAWFWLGVVLVVLNVAGFLASTSSAPGGEPFTGPESAVSADSDAEEHRLDELLALPGVAAALAAGPEVWRQVSYLDDPLGPTTAEELAEFVWLEHDDDGWSIGLGDEVKPYLDLDVPEEDDPIIAVLEGHPAVEDAYHEDREVYRVEERHPLSTQEFAELAARALVAHHAQAAARL